MEEGQGEGEGEGDETVGANIESEEFVGEDRPLTGD